MQRSTLCKLGLLKTCRTLSINSDCYTAKFINMGKLWHEEAESLLLLNEEESKKKKASISSKIYAG